MDAGSKCLALPYLPKERILIDYHVNKQAVIPAADWLRVSQLRALPQL